MRGTPIHTVTDDSPGRIIPADAGNTKAGGGLVAQGRDHPRGCGEHSIRSIRSSRAPGSSPRMRGTPVIRIRRFRLDGIIPADAGNTQRLAVSGATAGDHPRGCGEHARVSREGRVMSGSSPRMRGTQEHQVRRAPQGRIIPTDAGNTIVTIL